MNPFATSHSSKLRAGDIVEVLSYSHIMETLDENGQLDKMPFMPEMIKYCGQQFRVYKRANYVCIDGNGMGGLNKTVTLENIRCDGTSHHDCKKSCSIFWKEDWLEKCTAYKNSLNKQSKAIIDENKLKTYNTDTGKFVCQSTCLSSASTQLKSLSKFRYLLKELFSHNRGIFKSLKKLFYFIGFKILHKSSISCSRPLVGISVKTPTTSLNLQASDWVEVKSFEEIIETLDREGKNRGLLFTAEMHNFCGNRHRVKNKLDKMISEESFQMVELTTTVLLEDVTCQAECTGFGCSRHAYHYWREIWLKKI
jgi:hypothetical protein